MATATLNGHHTPAQQTPGRSRDTLFLGGCARCRTKPCCLIYGAWRWLTTCPNPSPVIRGALGLHRRRRRPELGDLATLSGFPPRSILYALPEMRSSSDDPNLALHGRNSAGHPNQERLACRLCMAKKGIFAQVHCWMRHDQNACLRHRLWIGPGDGDRQQHLNLAKLPEVVTAQREHQKLIRAHGRDAVRTAFEDALSIHVDWLERPIYASRRHQRFGVVLGADWHVHQGTPIYYVVGYPEVIGLSGILVSPRWRTLTVNRASDGIADFYTEIRKVAPDYIPRSSNDPVLRWVDDQLRLNEVLRSGRDPRTVLPRIRLSETT